MPLPIIRAFGILKKCAAKVAYKFHLFSLLDSSASTSAMSFYAFVILLFNVENHA